MRSVAKLHTSRICLEESARCVSMITDCISAYYIEQYSEIDINITNKPYIVISGEFCDQGDPDFLLPALLSAHQRLSLLRGLRLRRSRVHQMGLQWKRQRVSLRTLDSIVLMNALVSHFFCVDFSSLLYFTVIFICKYTLLDWQLVTLNRWEQVRRCWAFLYAFYAFGSAPLFLWCIPLIISLGQGQGLFIKW